MTSKKKIKKCPFHKVSGTMPGALLASKTSLFSLNHHQSPHILHCPQQDGFRQPRGPALTQRGDGETLAFLLRAWRHPLVQGGPCALGGPQDVSPALFLASLKTVRSMWLLRHHRRVVQHTDSKHTQIRHRERSFRAWLRERERPECLQSSERSQVRHLRQPGSPTQAEVPASMQANGSLSMERCGRPGTNVASPITRPHPPSGRFYPVDWDGNRE